MSIEETDRQSAAVAKNPFGRISLAQIENYIAFRVDGNAAHMLIGKEGCEPHKIDALKPLTLCILVMKNGFVVIGKSAPADPLNFNAELGEKFAYEDAIRQLWPLMAFAMKTTLLDSRDKSDGAD